MSWMQTNAKQTDTPARRRSIAGIEARDRLLDTAERLLGESGLEGVSLRQIGAATGQGNNSAVQYHFGDKAGIISAIIERRVASFEARRQDLLESAQSTADPPDLRALLKVIFLPLAEATAPDGQHVYVRFISQFLSRIQYQESMEHPGWDKASAATRAVALLGEQLPFLGEAQLGARINRAGGLFFNALIDRDNALAQGRKVELEPLFFADVFSMMAAAIAAPIGA